ncbi:MAG: TetR/AcrR family transcriptional regulator [Ignavibacteriaceae bacterium]|jgi:AcrR family transcriptional regulator
MPRSKQQFQEMREKTRENILNSALKLFAEKGFNGTSINDIANAANISKGLAYNYFESKQKLIEAIFEELMKEGEKFIEIMDTVDDPYEKLRLIIEATFKYYEENEERWKLYTAFIFQPAMFEEGKKMSNYFNEKYLHVMEDIARSIGFINPTFEVKLLNALLDGIGLDYFFDKTMFPLNDVKEYLLKRYSKERIDKLNSLGLLD